MNDEIKTILERIARDIPEDTNLWPGVSARAGRQTLSMNPRTRLIWTVLLVALAFALFSTAAYALYRYFLDPGLQHVSQAGMISDLNVTAQPTAVMGTPLWGVPKPATQVDETQTRDGVSVTLNWVYVNDGDQAIGFTASGLGDGLRLGLPTVTYAGVTPEQFTGAAMRVDEAGNALLATYQIVRDGVQDSKVDVGIDIPIKRHDEVVTTFHFDAKDVPVDMIGGGGGNAYAVRVNGVELRQEYIIVAPDYTEAEICYPRRSEDDWQLQDVLLQFTGENGQRLHDAVAMESAKVISDENAERCAVVTFPLGLGTSPAAGTITSRVDVASIGTGTENIEGPWQFGTILDILVPAEAASLSTSTPQPPVAEQTIGDLTAVLDWAYADANRLAFNLHFDGWQDGYFLNGISLQTADGTEVNSGTGAQPAQDQPSQFTLEFEPADELQGNRFDGQLIVAVSNDPSNSLTFPEYKFKLDLPLYPAITIDPMQTISANGTDVILQRVKVSPSYTYAYVCFEKPTTGDFTDWQVRYRDTAVSIGQDQALMSSSGMLYDSYSGDLGKAPEPGWKPPVQVGRCLKLGFPVGHHDRPETFTLTIPALEKSMPEVIPDADIARAQEILRTQGIEMSYTWTRGNGGGSSGPVFTKKPEGMTDAEAYQRFVDALGYDLDGPWVFKVALNP